MNYYPLQLFVGRLNWIISTSRVGWTMWSIAPQIYEHGNVFIYVCASFIWTSVLVFYRKDCWIPCTLYFRYRNNMIPYNSEAPFRKSAVACKSTGKCDWFIHLWINSNLRMKRNGFIYWRIAEVHLWKLQCDISFHLHIISQSFRNMTTTFLSSCQSLLAKQEQHSPKKFFRNCLNYPFDEHTL